MVTLQRTYDAPPKLGPAQSQVGPGVLPAKSSVASPPPGEPGLCELLHPRHNCPGTAAAPCPAIARCAGGTLVKGEGSPGPSCRGRSRDSLRSHFGVRLTKGHSGDDRTFKTETAARSWTIENPWLWSTSHLILHLPRRIHPTSGLENALFATSPTRSLGECEPEASPKVDPIPSWASGEGRDLSPNSLSRSFFRHYLYLTCEHSGRVLL